MKTYHYTKEEDQYLMENYHLKTSKELAERLGRTSSSIRARAVNVLKLKKGNRKYTHNEDFFSKIDTSKKAYILGLWFADGAIFKEGKNYWRFDLAQHKKDEQLLESIKKEMEYTGPLTRNGDSNLRLKIASNKLCKDLMALGGTQRKSVVASFPTSIPKHLVSHFVRGYFDGDGTTGIYKVKSRNKPILNLGMLGGENFLEPLQKLIQEETGVLVPIHYDKEKSAKYPVKFGNLQTSQNKALTVMEWLYSKMNKDDLFLTRKKEVFDQAMILNGGKK